MDLAAGQNLARIVRCCHGPGVGGIRKLSALNPVNKSRRKKCWGTGPRPLRLGEEIPQFTGNRLFRPCEPQWWLVRSRRANQFRRGGQSELIVYQTSSFSSRSSLTAFMQNVASRTESRARHELVAVLMLRFARQLRPYGARL